MANFVSNLSALHSFSVGQHATAYNIANVNTDKFNPVAVHYQSGRPADQGVRPVVTRPAPSQEVSGINNELHDSWSKVARSNTDLSREMVNMMINQRGFEANAVVIRTMDEMVGNLVDTIA